MSYAKIIFDSRSPIYDKVMYKLTTIINENIIPCLALQCQLLEESINRKSRGIWSRVEDGIFRSYKDLL